MAKVEGLFVGISTGASLAAVAKTLNEVDKEAKILTVNYDTGAVSYTHLRAHET